jgi:hypothetical protein
MKHCLFIAMTAALAFSMVAPAMADIELLTNGNMESVTGGLFDNWDTTSPWLVNSTQPISGLHSGEAKWGVGGTGTMMFANSSPENFTFSCDFAAFNCNTGGTDRSMNIVVKGADASLATKWAITTRVSTDDNGATQAFQLYDGIPATKSYKTIAGLTPLVTPTTDVGVPVWDTETPVVNHMVITTHFGTATPTYDITLNDNTVTGLSYYQVALPPTTPTAYLRIQALGSSSVADWLGDNFSVTIPTPTPEPSAIALLTMGLLSLLAYAWRKRK